MKKIMFVITLLSLLSLSLFPVKSIVLKDGKDYLETLVNNGIYCKFVMDADYYKGSLYLLDYERCTVFVVDFKSGKLIRTIFRKVQGPNELMLPMSIKVKNDKIYVLDKGFNGIKITDITGKPVNEIKTNGIVGMRNIDVNDEGKIFVGEYNSQTKTYVSVYNLKGERERSLIKINPGEKLPLERIHYQIRLDNDSNIVLLFIVLRELKKFNSTGELIWQCKIKNKLLDKYPKSEIRQKTKNTINTRSHISYFEITKNNNIFVGHVLGGSLFNSNGKFNYLITLDSEHGIGTFKIIDNKLITFLMYGEIIELFDLTEEIK